MSPVRELARKLNLPNSDRRDSQGLCFLGKVKFGDFVDLYLGTKPGDVVDERSGEVIGRHKGLWFHRQGQRKGLGGILNERVNSKGPWYVVGKDTTRNVLVVSSEERGEAESVKNTFWVEALNWIGTSSIGEGKEERMLVKVRHAQKMATATVGVVGDKAKVRLDEKDGGLAPGQYVAFYNPEGECLGSAIISEPHCAS